MFLCRNDCIDGWMGRILHIAQEMVCCNVPFVLRNYRRNNHTVTVELTNDETDFFISGCDRMGYFHIGSASAVERYGYCFAEYGAAAPITDGQVQYWFRMATGAWSIIGFFYLMALLKPQKYSNLISLLAWGTLFEGIVLLIHGLYLNLPLFPFAGDVGFCLIVGGGLLLCTMESRQ